MKKSSTKSVVSAMKKVNPIENFSERVKSVRSKLGLTQEQMAVALGITKGYVWSIEKGEKRPSQKVVSKLDELESHSEPVAFSSPRSLLKATREAKGMSQKDLARATGYGIGYIQALEDAGARLSEKFARKVAEVLDIQPEDLMRGSDQVPSLGVGEGTVGSIPNVITTDGIKARNIPLISMAQAGELIDHTDQIYDYESIVAYDVRDPKAIAVRIRGDSMSPEFPEGVVVVVCPTYEAHTGDYVIARLKEGGVVFKKLERVGATLRFISSNPAYDMISVEAREVAWCYPVDQVIRKLR